MSLEIEIRRVVIAEARGEIKSLENRLRKEIQERVKDELANLHYNAGRKWSFVEHSSLAEEFLSFIRMEALKNGRTIGGIWARLKKMLRDGELSCLEREEDEE